MAKPKTTKPPKKATKVTTKTKTAGHLEDVGGWELPEFEGEFTSPSLSWEDRQLLGNVARFLYSIVDPRFLRRAVRAGYSKAEHHLLWRLYDTAAGRDRGLDVTFDDDLQGDPERRRVLVEIDEFENKWFPRIDRIIRRMVPDKDVERFIATFFKDLVQQPLGPSVLGSVSTLLTRVDQLATSKLPGASKVLATVRERGVTEEKAREMRAKIASLRDGDVKPTVDVAAAKEAADKQATGLRDLRLAWNDWATTLRPAFNIREQIQLGLTDARSAPKPDGGGSGSSGAGGAGPAGSGEVGGTGNAPT